MKIQYVSDLHLEFRGLNFKQLFKQIGDVLCMTGDICACGNPDDFNIFLDFLEYICPKYKYIIHVAGNHEYYATEVKDITKDNTYNNINKLLKTLEKRFQNYKFLNCDICPIMMDNKNYYFIGATLWTYVNPQDYNFIEENMNDYQCIYVLDNGIPRKITVQDTQKLHRKHVNFIKRVVEKKFGRGKVILLTHHKPINDIDTEHKDVFTQAYETDLTSIIKKPINLAIHGHTHVQYDKIINGVRHVSNPKGYINQHTKFNDNLVIEL